MGLSGAMYTTWASVSQRFEAGSSPKSWLTPCGAAGVPKDAAWPGERIHFQTTPVTMKLTAIGKTKMLRKTPSARICRSIRLASRRPMVSDAAMKKIVKTTVFRMSIRNRFWAKMDW